MGEASARILHKTVNSLHTFRAKSDELHQKQYLVHATCDRQHFLPVDWVDIPYSMIVFEVQLELPVCIKQSSMRLEGMPCSLRLKCMCT